MRIGVPREIKETNSASASRPPRWRNWSPRPRGDRRGRRGPGQRPARQRIRGGGRAIVVASRARGVRRGRDDREGEGAAARRARDAAPGTGAVHLSASRARSGAGARPHGVGRDLHRLRDGDLARRRPAAAHPHVGSRRAPRARRSARIACRRSRAGAACCWAACRACRRPRSWCWAAAWRARTPPPSRWAWAPTSRWSIAIRKRCAGSISASAPACARSSRRARPSRPWCAAPTCSSAPCWCPAPQAPKLVTRDMVRAMKHGRGHRRRVHRPGRLLRNLAPHHPFGADLCGGRRGALLRHQHARRGAAHLHLRPQQRHPAVRAGAGRAGLARGHEGGPAPAGGAQRPRGAHRLPPVAQALGLELLPAGNRPRTLTCFNRLGRMLCLDGPSDRGPEHMSRRQGNSLSRTSSPAPGRA